MQVISNMSSETIKQHLDSLPKELLDGLPEDLQKRCKDDPSAETLVLVIQSLQGNKADKMERANSIMEEVDNIFAFASRPEFITLAKERDPELYGILVKMYQMSQKYVVAFNSAS